MNQRLDPGRLRIFLEDDKGEKEVDLSQVTPLDFFKNDLVRYRLTGRIPSGPDFKKVNFVGCVLNNTTADGVDFSECDFKDTFLKGASFSNCKFDGGTFATTFFSNTEFRHCTFYNLAAYSCDFNQVHFIDCDLTNLLVKSSRFSQGTFQNCKTSNRVCEMSTLFDVNFAGTPIQIETITNNFGLTSSDLKDAAIRSGRERETHHLLQAEELRALLDSRSLTALEKLSLEYFLEHTLLNGSAIMDESLDIRRWTRIYRNPGSFVELLDKFAEFLLHLYDNNRLAVQPVLLLHHITSTLTNSISAEERFHRLVMSLGGIHLILSRIVEEYLHVLNLVAQHSTGTLVFRVEGPNDPEYFRTELGPWIGDEDEVSLRLEQNSPLILELTASNIAPLLSLLAAFLATRTKLEITRLQSSVEKAARPGKLIAGKRGAKRSGAERNLPALRQKPEPSLFTFRTGFVKTPTPAYEIQLQSRLPASLLLDLRLNFSTTLIHRLRSLLLDLLVEPKGKRR